MVTLTFAEQVRIVLGRKKMTIKQLAEEIEEKTGMKMSRQNLTQRLNRDNFQEQDMRMITEILGCTFQLSILEDEPEEQESARKIETKEVGAIKEESLKAESVKEESTKEELIKEELIKEEPIKEGPVKEEPVKEESVKEEPVEKELVKEEPQSEVAQANPYVPHREATIGEFTKSQEDVDEKKGDLKKGEINPYTGFEYKSNSVRTHKGRIGYVQVYDRKTHSWTDMTEWAFLGYQERQKVLLGKAYEQPTYLD